MYKCAFRTLLSWWMGLASWLICIFLLKNIKTVFNWFLLFQVCFCLRANRRVIVSNGLYHLWHDKPLPPVSRKEFSWSFIYLYTISWCMLDRWALCNIIKIKKYIRNKKRNKIYVQYSRTVMLYVLLGKKNPCLTNIKM